MFNYSPATIITNPNQSTARVYASLCSLLCSCTLKTENWKRIWIKWNNTHQINNIKEIWNKKEKAKQKNVHILWRNNIYIEDYDEESEEEDGRKEIKVNECGTECSQCTDGEFWHQNETKNLWILLYSIANIAMHRYGCLVVFWSWNNNIFYIIIVVVII